MPTQGDSQNENPQWQLDLSCSKNRLEFYERLYGPGDSDCPKPDTAVRQQTQSLHRKNRPTHAGFIDRFATVFDRCISVGLAAIAISLVFFLIVYTFAGAN